MATTSQRVSDAENVCGLIHRAMLAHQFSPLDIRDSRRGVVDVFGTGECACTRCDRTWPTRYSWIRFDLKEQRICYRWSMKCQQCGLITRPTFSLMEVHNLIAKAIQVYKGKSFYSHLSSDVPKKSREPPKLPKKPLEPPHIPRFCEKCNWGNSKCWLKKKH